MPLVRVLAGEEPHFRGFRFGLDFEHSIPESQRSTVIKGKAKRNVARALAACGRVAAEVKAELDELHGAEGELVTRRLRGYRQRDNLSPAEIMARVTAKASSLQPVMAQTGRAEERSEQLRRYLGGEGMERTRPPVHWADRKKLEILEQLRRDRTLCAPKPVCATMELDAEDVLADDSPIKIEEDEFITRRDEILAEAGIRFDPSLDPAALREQVARKLARRQAPSGKKAPALRAPPDTAPTNRFAGVFSEGDRTVTVYETDSTSENASTEMLTPQGPTWRRLSDVSLDRFGYLPFGGRTSLELQQQYLQQQQMQMQQQMMQQQFLTEQQFFVQMQQQQQQPAADARARSSFDSSTSSGATRSLFQYQGGWTQMGPPQLPPQQRTPWRGRVQGTGGYREAQPPPPPLPAPRGMFGGFGGGRRQATHNGPDTDEFRMLLSAPTEYANTLAATTEYATSFDGAPEVMSRYQGGSGGAAGKRRTFMSESMSEGGAAQSSITNDYPSRADLGSEGRASYYDEGGEGVEPGDEAGSGSASETSALLPSTVGAAAVRHPGRVVGGQSR